MKVTYELENDTLEFELSAREICEFIADVLYDDAKMSKEMPRTEFVARMTEALCLNTESDMLASAFGLADRKDEMEEYFAYDLLDKYERREWDGERGYDCDDKGD